MIDEYGVVRDRQDGRLAIEIGADGSCDACPIANSCAQVGAVMWVPDTREIDVGDRVHLTVENASAAGASARAYGAPLAAVVAGIVCGYGWLFRTAAANARVGLSVLLAGVLFVAVGIVFARIDRRARAKMQYRVERADIFTDIREPKTRIHHHESSTPPSP